MKKVWSVIISVMVMLCCLSSQANVTNLLTISFQGGAGVENSVNTNGFSYAVGSFYHMALGPSILGDTTANGIGWGSPFSSESNQVGYFSMTNWPAANSNGVLSCWLLVQPYTFTGTGLGGGGMDFMHLISPNGNGYGDMTFCGTNQLYGKSLTGFPTYLLTIPSYQWVWLAMSWHKVSPFNNNYDTQYWIATNGINSSPVMFFSQTNFGGPSANMCLTQIGNTPESANWRINGRIGMIQLSTYSTEYSDISGMTLSSYMNPPPLTNNVNFYCNTVTGNDTNSGTLPTDAWQSSSNLNYMTGVSGIIGNTNGYIAGGPTLGLDSPDGHPFIWDTNTVPFSDIFNSGANSTGYGAWYINTPGLKVYAYGNPFWTNQLDHVIATNSWTQVGTSHVWMSSDTQSNTVAWDNERWMNWPSGANFITVSNVMQATNGCCYTDGTNMFITTFEGDSPYSGSHRITRSVYRGGGGVYGFALNLNASGIDFEDCYAGKTAMFPCNGAYVLATGGQYTGGINLIKHCRLFYGDKHIFGAVAGQQNSTNTVIDVDCEQGSQYGQSQYPFVVYTLTAANSNNTWYFYKCKCISATGVIGSTTGYTGQGFPAFYSHDNIAGFTNNFYITIDSCDFEENTVDGASAAFSVVITNSIFGGGQSAWPYETVVNSKLIGGIPSVSDRCQLIVSNCTIINTNITGLVSQDNAGSQRSVSGTNIWVYDTFVYSPASAGGDAGGGAFLRSAFITAPITMYASNDVFVLQGPVPVSLFENFSSLDTFSTGNNLFVITNILAENYTNGTASNKQFNNWVALGFDLGSISNGVSKIDATTLVPYMDSQAIGLVTNAPAGIDYTGFSFSSRRTAGALEPHFNGLHGLHF